MVSCQAPHQCFVCCRKFPPEQLGRVYLPILSRRGRGPWSLVICVTCYGALCDYWSYDSSARAPILHGY